VLRLPLCASLGKEIKPNVDFKRITAGPQRPPPHLGGLPDWPKSKLDREFLGSLSTLASLKRTALTFNMSCSQLRSAAFRFSTNSLSLHWTAKPITRTPLGRANLRPTLLLPCRHDHSGGQVFTIALANPPPPRPIVGSAAYTGNPELSTLGWPVSLVRPAWAPAPANGLMPPERRPNPPPGRPFRRHRQKPLTVSSQPRASVIVVVSMALNQTLNFSGESR
jgi:hypothetical protein